MSSNGSIRCKIVKSTAHAAIDAAIMSGANCHRQKYGSENASWVVIFCGNDRAQLFKPIFDCSVLALFYHDLMKRHCQFSPTAAPSLGKDAGCASRWMRRGDGS